jgi:NADPH2:quinone reductase
MKAIRVEKTGGPEVLKLVDVPNLEKPGPGQVVVGVIMAGVNFMDVGQRRGTYPNEVPFIPGAEGSGVVEAVGQDVILFKLGDRVAFTGATSAYAEKVLIKADQLIPLPDDLSFEQGAAFPLQGMTAHYLIHAFGEPGPGDFVLIHAAAGGVGSLLVQWAHHLGAKVIGTVSTQEKAQSARDAGADHVVITPGQNFVEETRKVTGGRGANLILDGVGKSTFMGDLETVAVHGHIVVFGGASGAPDPISPMALMAKAVSLSGGRLQNFIATRGELLRRSSDVMEGIYQGWLQLRVEAVFPLAQAAKAHELLENRKTQGKLLLSVTDPK